MIPNPQDVTQMGRVRPYAHRVLTAAPRGLLIATALTFLVVTAAGAACQTARSATYLPGDGAPVLAARGGGCHVDVFLAGEPVELAHPHRVVGEIEAHRSQEQMREGGAGAVDALKVAACEAGVFVILDIKAFPGGTIDGGATYIGKAAVLLDDKGGILGEAQPADTESSNPESGGGAATDGGTLARPVDAGTDSAIDSTTTAPSSGE